MTDRFYGFGTLLFSSPVYFLVKSNTYLVFTLYHFWHVSCNLCESVLRTSNSAQENLLLRPDG